MTKAEKLAAYEMALDGHTYTEIAQKFGVSRQYMYSIISTPCKQRNGSARCIYPGLSAWMKEKQIGAPALEACFKSKHRTTIYNKLSGKRQLTVTEAKAILNLTGLTFEEAFGNEEST